MNNKVTNEKLFEAIELANKIHTNQFRKSTRIPKLVHLVGVMNIILENGYDDDLAIAGVLHDALEDTLIKPEDIEQKFGTRVVHLIKGASEEDKSLSWFVRKQSFIKKMEGTDLDILVLVCADKIDNFKFTRKEYDQIGDDVWKRFNEGKEMQKWYFDSLISIFNLRFTDEKSRKLLSELIGDFNHVFMA